MEFEVYVQLFSSGFPFFLIHEFVFQTGRSRAAEYRMMKAIFVAVNYDYTISKL